MKHRLYSDDYNYIMEFLREMYVQTGTQHCWLPQRWEYAEHFVKYLNIERGGNDWQKSIAIWEQDGRIIGICNGEEGSDAFLQVRPGYETLTDEMLDFAEANIAFLNLEGKKVLHVWSTESNLYFNERLTYRGYTHGEDGSYYNCQQLDKDYIPVLPEGYAFADATEVKNTLARYRVVNRAFNPEVEIPQVVPESFLRMEKSPLFRPDLEIMVKNEDGTLVSFCVVWYDERTSTGMFEPVGTHPDFLRRGLGRAMLIEGLRRLKDIGAKHAYVDSYGDDRRAFYNSAGFITFDKDWFWRNEL
jgi:GNAT superfamily N-acetyltransferase